MTEETKPEGLPTDAAREAPAGGDAEREERHPGPILDGQQGIDAAQVWISGFLIVIAGAIAFSNALGIPFHAEDQAFIVDNAALHYPASFPQALAADAPPPLTMFTFALNWWLTPDNAVSFHAVNLFLHLLNAILVFMLCRRVLNKTVPEAVAMLAGLLYALHPANTESVNYIVGRAGLLLTCLVLTSMLLFLRATRANAAFRPAALAGSLVCFFLAWGSADAAWAVPPLILTLDWVQHPSPDFRKRLRYHVPYWGLLLILCTVGLMTRQAAPGAAFGLPSGTAGLGEHSAAFVQYVLLAVTATGLSVEHAIHPGIGGAFGFVVFCLSAFAAIALVWRKSPLGFALTLFLLALLPVLVLKESGAPITERSLSLSLAGVALIVPWLFAEALRTPASRTVGGLVAAALVLVAGVATFNRNSVWRDVPSLWLDAAAKAPGSPRPDRNLGAYHLARGQAALVQAAGEISTNDNPETDAAAGELREAEKYLRQALKLEPEHPSTLADLGTALALLEQWDEAVDTLLGALRLDTSNQATTVTLAITLDMRARVTGNHDDAGRALDYFARAEKLGPLPLDAAARYGLALAEQGRFDEAQRYLSQMASYAAGRDAGAPSNDESSPFTQRLREARNKQQLIDTNVQKAMTALGDNPNDAEGLKLLGQLLLLSGRYQQALYTSNQVLSRSPQDIGAWVQMGVAKAKMNAVDSFLTEWPAPALSMEGRAPSRPPLGENAESPWRQLALTCASVGLWEQASAYLTKGPAPDTASPPALLSLAEIALELKQPRRAWEYLHQAGEAYPSDPRPWLRLCDMALAGKDTESAARFLAEAEKRNAEASEVAARKAQLGVPASQPL